MKNKKDNIITLRLDNEELKALKEYVNAKDITVSKLIRSLLDTEIFKGKIL